MKYSKQEDKILIEGILKGKTYEDVAVEVSKLGKERSTESIRNRYKRLRKQDPTLEPKVYNNQNKVKSLVEDDEPKFTVDKNNIVKWDYRHGEIELELSQLDDIFYRYSKHGLNMSQVQVQNYYGLTAIQWQSLKRTFDLVKDSDVFSPYSLSLVSGKEATEMIANKIAEKYSPKNMRDVIAYEDDKQRKKAYSKVIKKSAQLEHERQKFEDAILEYIVQAQDKVYTRKTPDSKIKHSAWTIQDLHVGANIKATHNLPEFNDKVIEDRLNQIANGINASKSKLNTIVFNGDLIETFTGLNHPNSWKNIDNRYGYGVKATIKATELITQFLQKVNNIHEVLFVSGNHDRVTSNNKEDVTGEVVQWVHYMIKQRFGNKIKTEWSEDIIQRTIEGISYMWTHGHLGISKRNSAEIVNQYGDPSCYNVIFEGHLHTRKIKGDSAHLRHIVGSSIFTGNDYSKQLGFSTLPGYMHAYRQNVPYPVVVDIPLL